MSTREIRGRARRVGDDINTDYIISSRRKRETIDENRLKAYLFETLDPAFAGSVLPGDILVAGRNFGCGSAMEVAVTVPMAAGITAVLAGSFARSFFRNAINNGLVPVQCETGFITEGDDLLIRLSDDAIEVEDLTARRSVTAPPYAGIVLDILDAGGLVPFVRRGGLDR